MIRIIFYVFAGIISIPMLNAQSPPPFMYQTTIPDILPPSPSAYELGKFGNVPVGMFTGTAQYSIPIFEFKTPNIKIPITVDYNSNGIKVDQMPTTTGLGWNLNAGGVITRTIRGKPDDALSVIDYKFADFPGSDIDFADPTTSKYYNMVGYNTSNNFDSEQDLFTFNCNGYSGSFVFNRDNKDIILLDQQPLNFSYSNLNDGIFTMTASDGVIYTFSITEKSNSIASGCKSYSPDAYTYYTTAWYLSAITHPSGDVINFNYSTENNSSVPDYSYYQGINQTITKMVTNTSNCSASTNNSYCVTQISVKTRKLLSITSSQSLSGTIDFSYTNTPGSATYSELNTGSYSFLSQIKQSYNAIEYDRADFSYTNYSTSNKRVFLNGITFKDPKQKYAFEYIDPANVPTRLSFNQDYWGYANGTTYNGTPSDYFVPIISTNSNFYTIGRNRNINTTYTNKGLLNKITYPTKGYTTVDYEPNDYNGAPYFPTLQPQIVTNCDSYNNNCVYGCVKKQTVSFTIPASIYSDYGHPITLSAKIDAYGTVPNCTVNNGSVTDISYSGGSNCNVNPPCSPLTIYCQTYDHRFIMASLYRVDPSGTKYFIRSIYLRLGTMGEPKADSASDFTLSPGNYELTIQLSNCATGSAFVRYYAVPNTISDYITGGMRVKKTTDVPNETNTQPVVRNYWYRNAVSAMLLDQDISSGTQIAYPHYFSTKINGDCEYLSLSSNSLYALFNDRNNNVYYSNVIVSVGNSLFENGAEEHHFYNDGTYSPGNPILGIGLYDLASKATFNNGNSLTGKEDRIRYYRKVGTSLFKYKEITNEYYFEKLCTFRNFVFSKLIEYPSGTVYPPLSPFYCEANTTYNNYKEYQCTAQHRHLYSNVNSENAIKCIAPNHQNGANDNTPIKDVIHPCNNNGSLQNYHVEQIGVVRYDNTVYNSYLKSTKTMEYETALNAETTLTEYTYGNTYHNQITEEKTTYPDNSIIIKKYVYPWDLTNLSNTSTSYSAALNGVCALNNANIHIPIEKRLLKTNTTLNTPKVLDAQYIEYNPDSKKVATIYNLELNNPASDYIIPTIPTNGTIINTDTRYVKDAVFRYNTAKNLSEVKRTDNVPHSFLWNNSNNLLIAEIKNSNLSNIIYESFEGNITNPSNIISYTGTINNLLPKTGNKSLQITGSVSIPNPPLQEFVLSFWYKSSSPATVTAIANKPAIIQEIINGETDANGWKYAEYKISWNTSTLGFNINIAGNIDEIRVYPVDAEMTTYYYNNNNKLMQIVDKNNKVSLFEYDTYNRLAYIKDEDGSIIKAFQYNYKP